MRCSGRAVSGVSRCWPAPRRSSAPFLPRARILHPPQCRSAPYVAQIEDNLLVVSHGGEVVLRTEIDTRTLPAADREALADGIVLTDAASLTKLLEDYGS